MLRSSPIFAIWILSLCIAGSLHGQTTVEFSSKWSRQEVWRQTAAPYQGESKNGVDRSTLVGKVVCGYQGWYTCPGDGSKRGWHHWGLRGQFKPGVCTIDLWPDVSELAANETYATEFRLANGERARVYSPLNETTVSRHFEWMETYGIDGVFVQRFGSEIRSSRGLYHFNRVLANCRTGANLHGRTYAVMYDLSGMRSEDFPVVKDDWKQLVGEMRLGRDGNDRGYQFHRGKPLVAIWGVGFSGDRKYSLKDCQSFIDFLKNDSEFGGNAVMIGVPSYWRTQQKDAVADPLLLDIVRNVDIVSPWSVGRFRNSKQMDQYAETVWTKDLEWCRESGVDYLPVVFPGFSWHNLKPESPLGIIPRRGGQFLWDQYLATKKSGARMIYQAMFDEMDEGTAIFKCSPDPPVGVSKFLNLESKPSDHYLWLVGQGGRLIRGEIETSPKLPQRFPVRTR